MTTPDLERRIRTWFADEIGEGESAPSSVYAFLGAIPQSMPRQQGLFGRRAFILLAAALLVGLLAGAIAVGSGVIKLPSFILGPSLAPEASTDATPSSSAEPSIGQPLGLIVYNVLQLIQPLPDNCTPSNHPWCHVQRIWIAKGDGTAAHELLPDVPGDQQALGWTPDGSQLLYQDSTCELRFADAEGVVVDTLPRDVLFPTLSADDCPDLSAGFSFSPDGTRLAYVVGEGAIGGPQVTTVVVYDMGTRELTRLDSTSTHDTETCVTANEGINQGPMWFPDGTRLVVTRDNIGPVDENHACRSIVFTVNADGTDFRVVVPSKTGSQPLGASWSPDGLRIVFRVGNYANGGAGDTCDVAIVRPDGSDLRQLTSDGISCWPSWTEDGRILFIKFIDLDLGTSNPWIMDADGSNATLLQGDLLAEFTTPPCGPCPYANPDATGDGFVQPLP
jgi:Tol biopolymer transport system component